MVHKSKVIYIYFLNKTSNWWFINSVVTKFLHKHGKEYEDHFKIRKMALKKKLKQRQETKGTNGGKKIHSVNFVGITSGEEVRGVLYQYQRRG